jgi:hypothetical protein
VSDLPLRSLAFFSGKGFTERSSHHRVVGKYDDHRVVGKYAQHSLVEPLPPINRCSRGWHCSPRRDSLSAHLLQIRKTRGQERWFQTKDAQDQTNVANMVALGAEKDNDDAQKEVQELQRVMEPKRPRTHTTAADDDEECENQSWEDWDLPDHRRETTHIQTRRSIPLDSRGEVPTPPEGKVGPLERATFCIVAKTTQKEHENQ